MPHKFQHIPIQMDTLKVYGKQLHFMQRVELIHLAIPLRMEQFGHLQLEHTEDIVI